MGDLSQHFSKWEFRCRDDCGEFKISLDLIEKLENMRADIGVPIYVNFGFRCKAHNKSIGGSETSAHLHGEAADIACNGSLDRHLKLREAYRQFQRIGIHKDFIHVDVSQELSRPVTWLYPTGNNRKNLIGKEERDSRWPH